MGSLVRDQGGWIILEKQSPASPLIPFHQRQNNRSPLESPPVAKKLPKVKDSDLFFGRMFVDLSSSSATSPVYLDLADGKENRSILKKAGPKMNNHNRSLRSSGRRVDFDQDVVVYHFDRVEGGHVSSESQRLSDQKDRKEFVNRNVQGRTGGGSRAVAAADAAPHSARISFFGQREPPIQYAVPLPVTSQYPDSAPSQQQHHHQLTSHYEEPAFVTSSQYDVTRYHPVEQQTPVYCASLLDRRLHQECSTTEGDQGVPGSETAQQEVEFSFFEDDRHHLRLKFSLSLGDGVAANDVLVKANTAGNKVRVVGTRTVGTSRQGTIIRQEFTERYQLPMEVNPYMIVARMDNSGNLYVEAPVMTVDIRRALSVERQTIDGARIGAIPSADFVL